MVTTIPQPDDSTVWLVVEDILKRLSDDPIISQGWLDQKPHFDWWWEQPFFETDEYALPPLCFYISADVVEITNESDNRDRVRANFTIYMEWRSNADSHHEAATKERFLQFAPWYNAMHRALAGYRSDNMQTALRRVAGPMNVPGLERKGVLLSTTYSCLLYDMTATPEKLMAQILNLKINGDEIKAV